MRKQEEKTLHRRLYGTESAGALFSGAAVLMVLVSVVYSLIVASADLSYSSDDMPDWAIYCSYILPQAAFLIAIAAFFLLVDVSPRETYRGTKPAYFALAVLLQFGLFSLSWANGMFIGFLEETVGYTASSTVLPSTEGWRIVTVILAVAVLPAIFEETIFRGLMLGPLKRLSTPAAVLLSGLLFALYHQSPAQTVYQFCCGCAFALIAIRANSVLPTMLSHFLNNAFIIILYACGIEDFSGTGGAVFYALSGCALAFSLAWLIFADRKTNTKKTESAKPFFLYASVGIAVCGISWVLALF